MPEIIVNQTESAPLSPLRVWGDLNILDAAGRFPAKTTPQWIDYFKVGNAFSAVFERMMERENLDVRRVVNELGLLRTAEGNQNENAWHAVIDTANRSGTLVALAELSGHVVPQANLLDHGLVPVSVTAMVSALGQAGKLDDPLLREYFNKKFPVQTGDGRMKATNKDAFLKRLTGDGYEALATLINELSIDDTDLFAAYREACNRVLLPGQTTMDKLYTPQSVSDDELATHGSGITSRELKNEMQTPVGGVLPQEYADAPAAGVAALVEQRYDDWGKQALEEYENNPEKFGFQHFEFTINNVRYKGVFWAASGATVHDVAVKTDQGWVLLQASNADDEHRFENPPAENIWNLGYARHLDDSHLTTSAFSQDPDYRAALGFVVPEEK